MDKTSFRPVRGLESDFINMVNPPDGYVWFATDTQKIYYSNGSEFIPMGGNSAIFYGTLDTKESDQSQTQFEFTPDDIEKSDKALPKVDDLILNNDGCFYRVTSISQFEDQLPVFNVDKLTIAGSGGGGEPGNKGVAKVTTVGSNRISIIKGKDCILRYTIECADSAGQETSGGTVEWKVNNTVRGSTRVTPGENQEFNIGEILATGNYTGTAYVKGAFTLDVGEERPRTVYKDWIINIIDVKLTWDYEEGTINKDDTFSFVFNMSGSGIEKTAHILLHDTEDGSEYEVTHTTQSSARQIITIDRDHYSNYMSHGVHSFSMYVSVDVNGESYQTDTITHPVVFAEPGNMEPIMALSQTGYTTNQYDSVKINYVLYDPRYADNVALDPLLQVLEDGAERDTIIGVPNGTPQAWTYTAVNVGSPTLTFVYNGGDIATVLITVKEIDLGDTQEPLGCVVNFNASRLNGNNETLKKWTYDGANGLTFSDNFDWVNGGLKVDDENRPYLCVKAGTRAVLHYNLLEKEPQNGKTIKVIFKTINCCDYDAVAITCMSNNTENYRGLRMQAQSATYRGSATSLTIPYCEDSYMELAYDIWPKSDSDRLYMMGWIDGVPCALKRYTSGETFSQRGDIPITIGSDDCDVWLYLCKIYERHLEDNEHLSNFILDAGSAAEMVARFQRNNILNDAGEIDYAKLIEKNPGCWAELFDTPTGIPTHKSTGVPTDVGFQLFTDGDTTSPAVQAENVKLKTQGTSSMAYGVSAFNFDVDMKADTVTMIGKDGEELKKGFALSEHAFPQKYFNIKLNVASCEGANNAVLQDWYNEYQPYMTAYRASTKGKDQQARDTMEFHPGIVFIKDHTTKDDRKNHPHTPFEKNGQPSDNVFVEIPGYIDNPYYKMYGIGCIGNSKKNTNAFHDKKNINEMCVEIADNQYPLQFLIMRDVTLTTEVDPKTGKEIIKASEPVPCDRSHVIASLDDSATGYDMRYPDFEDLSEDQKNSWADFVEWFDQFKPTLDTKAKSTGYSLGTTDAKEQEEMGRLLNQYGGKVQFYARTEADKAAAEAEGIKVLAVGDGYHFKKTIVQDITRNVSDGDTPELETTKYTYETVTGNAAPVIRYYFADGKPIVYDTDTEDYRMAKFIFECEDHIILDSLIYHYLTIERHLMIDNVAKNTFWETEDGKHWQLTKNYDDDTAEGNNNSGLLELTYGYEFGDTENWIPEEEGGYSAFNGASALWINYIDKFPTNVFQTMYSDRSSAVSAKYGTNAWSAKNFLAAMTRFQDVIPERCWIEDYYRKYRRPLEVYGDAGYLAQLEGGKKTQQRRQFETYEERYFESEYIIGDNTDAGNSIQLRANTKTSGETAVEIPVTLYADCYLRYCLGQSPQRVRAKRNQPISIEIPANTDLKDGTVYIFLPDYFSTIANLSKFNPKVVNLSPATRLREFVDTDGVYANLDDFQVVNCTLLRHLAVHNINNTIASLDLSKLNSLQDVDLTSSNFNGITLPVNAPLKSVKLENPTSIVAKDLYNLSTFRINDISKIQSLFFDNIDNHEIDDFVCGSETDSGFFDLSKHIFAAAIKQSETFSDISAANSKWELIESSEISGTNIPVLDNLLTKNSYLLTLDAKGNYTQIQVDVADAITGSVDVTTEAYNDADSVEIYEKYIEQAPNLDISFEGDVAKLHTITFMNGDNRPYKTRKIQNNGTLTLPTGYIDEGAVTKTNTTQYVYHKKLNAEGEPLWSVNGEEHTLAEINNGEVLKNVIEDVTIEPIFESELRQYTVKIYNYDGTSLLEGGVESKQYPYGTKIVSEILPTRNPTKQLSTDPLETVWQFLGYSMDQNAVAGISYTEDSELSANLTLYAIYKIANVRDPDYIKSNLSNFIFEKQNGVMPRPYQDVSFYGQYVARIKRSATGKIVVPNYYEGIPVVGVQENEQMNPPVGVTHVFLESDSSPMIFLPDRAFYNCTSLKYFDFASAKNLQFILTQAFWVTALSNNTLSENLKYIGVYAFNQTFTNMEGNTLYIPASVEIIEACAFSYNRALVGKTLQLGDNLNLSQLNIESSCQYNTASSAITADNPAIVQNPSEQFKQIIFYTGNEKYLAQDNPPKELTWDGGAILLRAYFGLLTTQLVSNPEAYSPAPISILNS